MRLSVMVLALTLACAAAVVAADSTTVPCPTTPTVSSATCPSALDTCLINTYGLTSEQIADLRTKGMSDRDIATAAVIAKSANQSITQVLDTYNNCGNWSSVASNYNLSMTDINNAVACCLAPSTVIAAGAGPMLPGVMFDMNGNVLLTQDQVDRFYRQGNDWLDVAIAANIARESGYPVDMALMDIRRGVTYQELARVTGVVPERAFNVADYPFARRSIYSESTQAANMSRIQKYQQAGTFPMGPCGVSCKPVCTPCPTPCPAPTCP